MGQVVWVYDDDGEQRGWRSAAQRVCVSVCILYYKEDNWFFDKLDEYLEYLAHLNTPNALALIDNEETAHWEQ